MPPLCIHCRCLALLFLRRACPCFPVPVRCQARPCLCIAARGVALLCRRFAAHGFACAILRQALPVHSISSQCFDCAMLAVLCRRDAVRRLRLAVHFQRRAQLCLRRTMLFSSPLCRGRAQPGQAMPQRCDSDLCYAVAMYRFSMPMLFVASPVRSGSVPNQRPARRCRRLSTLICAMPLLFHA